MAKDKKEDSPPIEITSENSFLDRTRKSPKLRKVRNRRNQKRILNFPRGRQVILGPGSTAELTQEEINSTYFKNRAHNFALL